MQPCENSAQSMGLLTGRRGEEAAVEASSAFLLHPDAVLEPCAMVFQYSTSDSDHLTVAHYLGDWCFNSHGMYPGHRRVPPL